MRGKNRVITRLCQDSLWVFQLKICNHDITKLKILFCMTEAEAHCTDYIYTQLSSYDPWLSFNAICQNVELTHSLNFSPFPEFSLMEWIFCATWDSSNGMKFFALVFRDWGLLLYNKTFSPLAKLNKERAQSQLEADKKILLLWSYSEYFSLG